MRNTLTRFLGIAVAVLPAMAFAASVNYGDKNAADYIYRQVSEDSITDPVPLFGNPAVFGNSLVFTPVNFGATSTGGGHDITDSTLSTTIEAKPNKNIGNIIFNEAGDYTLLGVGNTSTTATVTATYFVRVVEVNGAPITPIQQNGSMTFTPSGGTYDLVNDAGAGIIWSGSTNIDVNAILASANVQGVATKVLLSLDNQLIATSQSGTTAFIKKKTADGVIIIVLPEPATLGMIGGVGVTLLRRRR